MRALLLSLSLTLFAQTISGISYLKLPEGTISGQAFEMSPKRDIQSVSDGIIVTYEINGALLFEQPGGTYSISVSGFGPENAAGKPATVARTESNILPYGCDYEISLLESSYTEIPIRLAPAAAPVPEIPDSTAKVIGQIDSYTGFYPAEAVKTGKSGEYRGQKIARINVSPTQYDNTTKTLRIYNKISYKLTYKSADKRQTEFSISDEVGSWTNTTPAVRSVKARGNSAQAQSADAGYLIITIPNYRDVLNEFVEWKRMLGYKVTVLTDNSWTPETIKAAIKEQYEADNSLMYVLFVGTNDQVPGQTIPETNGPNQYGSSNTVLSEHLTDYYYGCMGGDDDDIPDLYSGRWPVWNYDDLETVADRTLWYEQEPTTDSLFYRKAVHCAYFIQDEGRYAMCEERRFVNTSEDIRDYMQDYIGKEVERIYWGVFQTDATVMPQAWNRTRLGDGSMMPEDLLNYDWNTQDFSHLPPSINDGRLYVLYRGHGEQNQLTSNIFGTATFGRPQVKQLDNTEWQPLFFSICCLTGDYRSECLADILLTRRGGGPMGVYAASEVSYSGYNDALTCGLFSTIWPSPGFSIMMPGAYDFGPYDRPTYRLGPILDLGMQRGLSFYTQSDAIIKYTKEVFNLFGDPSLDFNTEVPREYSYVTVDSTSNSLTVDLGNDTGYIGFFDQVTGTSSRFYGNAATFPCENPQYVKFTVSDHNRIPYICDAEQYYPPEGGTELPPNRIISVVDNHNSTITINYALSPEITNAYIVVVDIGAGNREVANIRCRTDENHVSAHVPYGVYAVSLMINDRPSDTKKIFVSHLNY